VARVEFQGWDVSFRPEWSVDYWGREHNLPGGARLEPSAFPNTGQYTVTAPSGAAAAATSIVVSALPAKLPANTLLDFTGTGEITRVTADAPQGATSISVEALDAAIEAGDTAPYGNVRKSVIDGTVIGRTNAERDSFAGFGPAADTDDEIYILLFTVFDANLNPDCELLRKGSGVKYNRLPGYAGLSAAIKTALANRYELVLGG
jgi:hypothetical protein